MSKLTVLNDIPGDHIHGVVDFIAPRFLLVQTDPADVNALIKATNIRRPYLLDNEVVEKQSFETLVFNDVVLTPVVKGLEASARRARWIEAEGSDHLVQSGTGSLSAATAVDTALEVYNGQLRAAQEGNEVVGRIAAKLAPEDEGNAVRFRIELYS